MASSSILQGILDGPALMPPPGVQSNFVDPPNINTACLVVWGIFLFGTTLAICIRMYTNGIILRSFYWEDYFLLIGSAFYFAYCVDAHKALFAEVGIHQWNIQVKNIGEVLYLINIGDIMYNCAIPFIKVSILLQYLRIFAPANRVSFMYIGFWAMLLSITIFYTTCLFIVIFPCTPRKKYWNPLIQGTCRDTAFLNNATGLFNVLTDIILVLLPQHEIWKLHMSSRKKIAVSALFLVALCAVVSSIFRLYYSVKIEQTGDLSYYVALQGLWANVENSIGIICFCLPVCPKFFRVIGTKVASLYKDSSTETPLKPATIAKRPRSRTRRLKKPDSIWNTSSGPQSQMHGTYETLEDDHKLLHAGTKEGDMDTTLEGLHRHELNDSRRGIKMIRTIDIESAPASSKHIDLEGQKSVKQTQMDW